MLAAGSLFLVAPPNVGKTWLALVVSKLAAWQGRRVFIIEEEGGLRAFSNRIGNLAFPLDAPVSVALQRGVKLDNRTTQALVKLIAAEEAPVLVLDNLGAMFEGNENETEQAGALMRRLMTIQRANPRLLLVLLHHSSKSGAKGGVDGGPATYAARGSSVFSGWCDTQLNLEAAEEAPGSGRVSFFIDVAKQRDEEKAARHKMTISLGTGEYSLVAASAAARDSRAERAIAALQDAPDGMSRNKLADAMGGNRQYALRTIATLVSDGTLVPTKNGVALSAGEGSPPQEEQR